MQKRDIDLKKAFGSPIHRKILVFFHENQGSIDTPRGIATWIGEERGKVKKALEDLVAIDVLVAHRSTSTTGYSYTIDSARIASIGRMLKRASR